MAGGGAGLDDGGDRGERPASGGADRERRAGAGRRDREDALAGAADKLRGGRGAGGGPAGVRRRAGDPRGGGPGAAPGSLAEAVPGGPERGLRGGGGAGRDGRVPRRRRHGLRRFGGGRADALAAGVGAGQEPLPATDGRSDAGGGRRVHGVANAGRQAPLADGGQAGARRRVHAAPRRGVGARAGRSLGPGVGGDGPDDLDRFPDGRDGGRPGRRETLRNGGSCWQSGRRCCGWTSRERRPRASIRRRRCSTFCRSGRTCSYERTRNWCG